MNTQEFPREEVARLAYQLWEERGCPIGSPEVDWERAEKALQHDASSDGRALIQSGDIPIDSAPGLDASAGRDDAGGKLDGAAAKSSRRPSRASGRANEGPRRSTQVR